MSDTLIAGLRRRLAADPGDREVRDRLSVELRRTGFVEDAFRVLDEAGAIGPRLLEALRATDRPWPWNQSTIHGNKWRWSLGGHTRDDYTNCITYENPQPGQCELRPGLDRCIRDRGHPGRCSVVHEHPCTSGYTCALADGHDGECF